MMNMDQNDLINWDEFEATRRQMGPAFVRIFGYFQEDGVDSVRKIEEAMRGQNAVALVMPAHKLKGEARQFGAERLANLAEEIEMVARHCVETRETPDELIPKVVGLRALFETTVQALDDEINPLVRRRPAG